MFTTQDSQYGWQLQLECSCTKYMREIPVNYVDEYPNPFCLVSEPVCDGR